MRSVFSVWVQNVPGVLSHVAGLLASRGYNVDSLTVGATEDPKFSRMTIVLDVESRLVAQVEQQLQKLVTVVKTTNISHVDHIERDVAFVRVAAEPGERSKFLQIVQNFRDAGVDAAPKVVEIAPKTMLVELVGRRATIDAFLDEIEPERIVSLTRSGCVATVLGDGELLDKKRRLVAKND